MRSAAGCAAAPPMGDGEPGWLSFGWLKLFADGTLGSRTAALLEPIEGGTDDRGMFTTPPERLAELAQRAAAAGIATQIHAIGDAAVRTSLDVLAPTAGSVAFMPRLEHIQLCHPGRPRPVRGARGSRASVQPVHLREDAATARRDWGDRAESAGYTWRSLLDAGAALALRNRCAGRADRPMARRRDGSAAARSVVGSRRCRRTGRTRR